MHGARWNRTTEEKLQCTRWMKGFFFNGFTYIGLFFSVTDLWCVRLWEVQNLWNNKTWKVFKYSLLLRSRLLSNTVHSQLKTTAWLLPERHGSTRCSNIGSYVCPVHSHQLPWGVFGTFWPVGNVGREGLWPTEETKGISQMVKSS